MTSPAVATTLTAAEVCDEYNQAIAKVTDPNNLRDLRPELRDQMTLIAAKASGDLRMDMEYLARTANEPATEEAVAADKRISDTCRTREYLGMAPATMEPTIPASAFQATTEAGRQVLHLTHKEGYKMDLTIRMYKPVDVTIEAIRAELGETCFKRLGSPTYAAAYKAIRVTSEAKILEVNGFRWPSNQLPETLVRGDGLSCGANISESDYPQPSLPSDSDVTLIYQEKMTPKNPQGAMPDIKFPSVRTNRQDYNIESCTIEGEQKTEVQVSNECIVEYPAAG